MRELLLSAPSATVAAVRSKKPTSHDDSWVLVVGDPWRVCPSIPDIAGRTMALPPFPIWGSQ